MRPIRRIVYIRTDRMGDVLMNMAAIRLLRQTFPKAWITLLVDYKIADLFQGCPDLDEVMIVRRGELNGSWRAKLRYAWQLKKGRFDMAIAANPEKTTHVAMALAGIPRRVGWERKWSFLLTRKIIPEKDPISTHEMDTNIRLVKLITKLEWDGSLGLGRDESVDARMKQRIAEANPEDRPMVAVHTGTSDPRKRWSFEKFAALCDEIATKTNCCVVLIGGPEERVYVEAMGHLLKHSPVDWVGALTLKELASFLANRQVRAIVSSDSGPVHVAWMSGTPAVVMFARGVTGSNPNRWGPRDGRSYVIYKPMADIKVAEVMTGLQRFIS